MKINKKAAFFLLILVLVSVFFIIFNANRMEFDNMENLPSYHVITKAANEEKTVIKTLQSGVPDNSMELYKLVNSEESSAQYTNKTYEYQSKLARTRILWLMSSSFLLLIVLILVAISLYKSRRFNKQLEALVKVRTNELALQTKKAEMANNAKSAFLANMSHEIRTPMNSILGITEILSQHASLPEKVDEGLGKIYSSCDLLLGIINNILDFSKIEAGKLDIVSTQYKIVNLINDLISLNLTNIYRKPIVFEIQIDENIPADMIGDELRIKQILSNLLSNAFKYTDKGKIKLAVSFEPALKLSNQPEQINLVLCVKDTGQGMTKEQIDNLFVEYSRFNLEKNITVEGTGLGLVITQRLINLMDGSLDIESDPGIGSVFTVKLPQKTVNSEVIGKEAAERLRQLRMNNMMHKENKQIMRNPMPYGRILIVDDVESNLYVAVGLLKLYRLQIDTASSGQETIDKIKDGNVYDIIFMDHMMPVMDGVVTTSHIRSLGYTAPIIIFTANVIAGQAEYFLQSGFDDYISKPINIRQLDNTLNKYIRDKQPPEVLDAVVTLTAKEVSGLDIAKGLRQYDDDEKTYIKILRSYANSVRTMLNTIETVSKTGLSEDDLEIYRIKVHGIKGTSFDIFAEEMGVAAKDLEDAAKTGDVGFINDRNPVFLEIGWKLVCDIEDLLVRLDDKNPKPKKDKLDKDVLENLLSACKNYDLKKMDNAMAEIEKYQYESDNELAEWLRDNIDKMNFKQIIEKISGLED